LVSIVFIEKQKRLMTCKNGLNARTNDLNA